MLLGRSLSTNLVTLLKLSASWWRTLDFGVWWKVWRHWGMWLDNRRCSEPSTSHWISKANSMFYAKKALFCDPFPASEDAY